ncbi:MAG: hypothetical protein B5M46_00175 [Epsilonproteobacteria bacterium 4484_20]|nr:MAG: hypothetical protein B5M46_00175 [Epsilonproteobacteria bacterium 4484_20]
MNKMIILCIMIMLSILSLYAGDQDKRGFTVTYLMLERNNIALPQDQTETDTNSTENGICRHTGDTE